MTADGRGRTLNLAPSRHLITPGSHPEKEPPFMATGQQTGVGDASTVRESITGAGRGGPVEEERGSGWVMFAAIMIMIAGAINLIYGIAAIGNAHFYVTNTHYVISDLNTWGWVLTVIGAVQLATGFGVIARMGWARWLGVAIASLNAIVQLVFLPSYPWLSLAVFALDLLVIYGLVAYGGDPDRI
jgi:hypothetical protein